MAPANPTGYFGWIAPQLGASYFWYMQSCQWTFDPNAWRISYIRPSVGWATSIAQQVYPSLYLCRFAIDGGCDQVLMRCPACTQPYSYSANCGGRLYPQVCGESLCYSGGPPMCETCSNPIPPNSIYTAPAAGTTTCGYQTCGIGAYRRPLAVTDGQVDVLAALGVCAPCPSLPANAYFTGTNGGPDWDFCTWQCNAGYRYVGITAGCAACDPPPAGGLQASPWGGGWNMVCAWTCPAGMYYSQTANACVACPYGRARASAALDPYGCPTQCADSAALWPTAGGGNTPLKCNAGYYASMGPIDCAVVADCLPCTAAPPAGSYYARDAVTQLSASATAPNQCNTRQCPAATRPGYARTGCGGTSPGTDTPCATLAPAWVDDVTAWTVPLRYYAGAGCGATAACAPCLSGGVFNAFCPARAPGLSLVAGACDTPCAPVGGPANGYFLPATTRAVANTTDCPFACNAGYYAWPRDGTPAWQPSCRACQTSADLCNAGSYIQQCGPAPPCQTCPGVAAAGTFEWLPSAAAYGAAASCQWRCVFGYYLASAVACAPCVLPTCAAVGQYLDAPCMLGAGALRPPTCQPCQSVANGTLVSTARAPNAPASCDVLCNTGFFATFGGAAAAPAVGGIVAGAAGGGSVCTPWTLPPAACPQGQFWGGGTPLTDQRCVACAVLPAGLSAAELARFVSWAAAPPCTWTCAAGAYLANATYCRACPAGTAKAGNGPGPCPVCAAGFYQASTAAVACAPVPANGVANANASGFACRAGYYLDTSDLTAPAGVCAACPASPGVASASYVALSNVCALQALACLPGYYRAASGPGAGGAADPGVTCVACPAAPSGAVASSPTPALAQTYCGPLMLGCGAPAYDEVTAACPIACAPGYYASSYWPAPTASLPAVRCLACAAIPCAEGQTSAPCTGGQTLNGCTACAPPASPGQLLDASCAPTAGCAPGYGGAGCPACSAGYFAAGAAGGAGACQPCPVGWYAPSAGASACALCAAGSYTLGGTVGVGGAQLCQPCAAGTYAPAAGATVCASCAALGAIAPLAGAVACQPCPPDTPVSSGTACAAPAPTAGGTACAWPGFYYSAAYGGAVGAACLGCPAGTYCPAGDAGAPRPCPPGTPPAPRLSASAAQCNASQLASGWRPAGAQLPVPCPAGTTTYGLGGATSAAWCYPAPGFYGYPGAVALPCPYDAYCPPLPALAPTPCPAGSYTTALGGTAPSACVASSSGMQPPCRPGYYAPWDAAPTAPCVQCPSGAYCPGTVLTNGTRVLPPVSIAGCPDTSVGGRWYSPPGASSADANCTTYPPSGQFLSCRDNTGGLTATISDYRQCRAAAGYYFVPSLTGTGVLCPFGYYCPAATLQPIPCNASAVCATLGRGYNPQPLCPPGVSAPGDPCVDCATPVPSGGGYYAGPGNCTTCCPAGFYKALLVSGQTTCVAVPDSTTCALGYYRPSAPACTAWLPACAACPPPLSGVSVPVPQYAGYDAIACKYQCVSGNLCMFFNGFPAWLVPFGGICQPTPTGTYAVTDARGTISGGTCPAGTYSATSGATACLACPPGALPSAAGSSACPCMDGNYAGLAIIRDLSGDTIEMQQCTPCPIGTTVVIAGGGTGGGCAACVAGTVWLPRALAWAAGACAPGTFRAIACQPCPAGSFSAAAEASACAPCPPGTYAPADGQSACLPCANGSVAAASGAACAPCPVGAASAAGQPCACPAGTFLENGACVACAARCPAPAVPANGSCPAGSTSPPRCACPPGYAGATTNCTPSPLATWCPAGAYYSAAQRGCVPCTSACPGALAVLIGACLAGATADAVVCQCPAGYYLDARARDCVPCSACAPDATLVRACPLGATRDATVCACRAGFTGDGVTACVCPPLTYRSPATAACTPCATCGANATAVATCAAGSTADTTRCACLARYTNVGNGTTCR